MVSYTRKRITTTISRWRVTEVAPQPIAGFRPTATSSSGDHDYHQWSVLDGTANRDEGSNYTIRADGDTRWGVVVDFDSPAPAGAVLAYTLTGTAGANQYTVIDSSPITVPQGSTSYTIRIDPADGGQWYAEKDLILTLDQANCVNLTVDKDHDELRLHIRSSEAVPTVDWNVTANSGGAGAHTLQVDLSAACREAVTVYYDLSGTIDGADYTITSGDESGSLTIPAGSTSATLDFTIGGGATSSETLIFTLDHPINTVDYALTPYEDIREDENLQKFTDEWGPDDGAFDVGIERPSDPSIYVTGGLDEDDSTDKAGTFVEIVEQTGVTAPDGGAIQGVVISQYHNSNAGTGYLRHGFEDQVRCGGPTALTPSKRWVRAAFRLAKFTGTDSWRNARFFQFSIRNRVKAMGHRVVVDTQSTGVDKDGNATTTWTMGAETWGVWDSENIGSNTTYGAVQQVFDGEGGTASSGTTVNTFWMVHDMDSGDTYGTKTEASGEPVVLILRPVHSSDSDGTADAWESPIAARGKGFIAYWPWMEMSATTLSGAPTEFWHKKGRWWEPRGNAAMVTGGDNTHTFTVA